MNDSLTAEQKAARLPYVDCKYMEDKLSDSPQRDDMCLPNGIMFDALGEPRMRYVRITLEGSHLVLTPIEAHAYMADARAGGDLSDYLVRDVYLSEREAEDLPELNGF